MHTRWYDERIPQHARTHMQRRTDTYTCAHAHSHTQRRRQEQQTCHDEVCDAHDNASQRTNQSTSQPVTSTMLHTNTSIRNFINRNYLPLARTHSRNSRTHTLAATGMHVHRTCAHVRTHALTQPRTNVYLTNTRKEEEEEPTKYTK